MIEKGVSILVPVYKMENTIAESIERAITLSMQFLTDFEIVLSDDGSPDNTLAALNAIAEKHPGIITVVAAEKNQGKGHALKRAFEHAKKEYIAFCDADMELSPEQLKGFFDIMDREKADVVIGSKRHPESKVNYSAVRQVISTIYFYFIKVFFRLPLRDTQTGLKLFKRNVLARVFPRILVKAFAYDLEILAVAHHHGYRIAEAPIVLQPIRNFGFIALGVLFQTFIDTVAIFYRLNIIKYYERLFDETTATPLVSIIIPLKGINEYIRQTTHAIKRLTYEHYELIILPDEADAPFTEEALFNDERITVLPTGAIPPAHKRHMGATRAKGEILAFIDDDTYPEVDWLYNAVRAFEAEGVNAVGGPAINAPDDTFMQSISGLVFSSRLVSGNYVFRYIQQRVQTSNDYPSCNLLVKRDLYFKVGGFNSEYWPGEDTIFCQNMANEGELVLYSPEVLVYHHRRTLFFGHFKQLLSYAWHRGYFVRKVGGNSLSLSYCIPSCFLLYLITLTPAYFASVAWLSVTWFYFYLAPLAVYVTLLLFSSVASFSIRHAPLKALGIFLSHLTYGFYFLKGLLLVKK